MTTFKCKMCGGDLSFEPGASVAECPYCGTKQTLPKLDDDKRANLYDRANHFRRQNEYDKAAVIYEQILAEDRTDAEAYWSLVLCKYGIEYVEDPASRKRVPTVNRAQYASILADEDYKAALQYADTYQRGIYEAEAAAIAEIQKGILDISKKEEPFDVFICYKETDANGRRTPDSVLATELYHELTKEGFKVFFSRITLEDKIGSAYEPYIFAALNSAKVMVVLGTKPEYFNAVWVKNEWSRYLALIRAGADKTLVPAYRDMDPYDLPEEFAHLQAQDMGKLGFMQDLVRGIKKIAAKDEPKPAAQPTIRQVVTGGGANIDNLMKRAQLFMEDGDWNSANEYLNKVLDENAEYAPAYAGKVQTAMKLRRESELASCLAVYENSADWNKALRFATPEQKVVYEGYVEGAKAAREEKRKADIYANAERTCQDWNSALTLDRASTLFASIPGYRNANQRAKACQERSAQLKYQAAIDQSNVLSGQRASGKVANQWEKLANDLAVVDWKDAQQRAAQFRQTAEAMRTEIYDNAKQKLEDADKPWDCEMARSLFADLGDYRDAKTQVNACDQKEGKIKAQAEAEREAAHRAIEEKEKAATKKKVIVFSTVVVAVIVAIILLAAVIIPNGHYRKGVELYDAGDYQAAASEFEAAGKYKDARKKAQQMSADQLYADGDYAGAWDVYAQLPYEYRTHADDYAQMYAKAQADRDAGAYEGALEAFKKLGRYSDANEQISMTYYAQGVALRDAQDWDRAVAAFRNAGIYMDAAEQIPATYYAQGIAMRDLQDWDEAVAAFENAGEYEDATEQIQPTYYAKGMALRDSQDWNGAVLAFRKAGNYKDAAEQILPTYYAQGVALREAQDWDGAVAAFRSAGEYEDAAEQISATYYAQGVALREAQDWYGAMEAFGSASEYSDAAEQILATYYAQGVALREEQDWDGAVKAFKKAGEYSDAAEQIPATNYAKGVALRDAQEWNRARNTFEYLGEYSDATEQVLATYYAEGVALRDEQKWDKAREAFGEAGAYSNAAEQILATYYAEAEALVEAQDLGAAAIAYGKAGEYGDAAEKASAIILSIREKISQYSGRIAAGYDCIFAVKSDGTVLAAGKNNYGQCNVGNWENIVAVDAGSFHTVGLKSDGTVVATGENDHGQCNVSRWTDIVAIATGDDHTVGLKSDGTVVAVGENLLGECNVSNWTNIVAIAAGDSVTLGLKSDGTVVATGRHTDGQCDVSDWKDIVAVAVGKYNTYGVRADGSVVAAGSNDDYLLYASKMQGIVAIDGGWDFVVGLQANGSVTALGKSVFYNSDNNNDIVAIDATHDCVAFLKADGTFHYSGYLDDDVSYEGNWKLWD